MRYRLAADEDLSAIQELSYQLFEDPTSSADKYSDHAWAHDERGRAFFVQTMTNEALWVAENDGRLVGYLAGGVRDFTDWRPIKRAELFSFYVAPAYRSQGVGKQLTELFFDWAKKQDADTAVVSAYADNERAIKFYRSVGFKDESLELEIDLK